MIEPWHVILFSALMALMLGLPVIFHGGAPFVPTSPKKISRLVKLIGVRPGTRAVDLGSGDGRLGLALARAGALVTGYEVNPLLVWWSRLVIRLHKQSDRFSVRLASYWNADLSRYDAVVVFGAPPMMPRLAEKLRRELKPGARIVSNGCHLPGWECKKQAGELLAYER